MVTNPLLNLVRHPTRVLALIQIVLLWMKSYFSAQNSVDPNQATIIETPLDQKIPHTEWAIYPYLFACGYILAIAWYVLNEFSHRQYLKASVAFKALIQRSTEIFTSHPTRMHDRSKLSHPLLRFTQTIDGQTNCFPSMHVSLVVLSYQIIKDGHEKDPLRLHALRQACIDISRSTMQTKQHSIIDVVGGIAIAKQVYHEHFEGVFEDLTDEIFAELKDEKLPLIKEQIDKNFDDLLSLLNELLEEFKQ